MVLTGSAIRGLLWESRRYGQRFTVGVKKVWSEVYCESQEGMVRGLLWESRRYGQRFTVGVKKVWSEVYGKEG